MVRFRYCIVHAVADLNLFHALFSLICVNLYGNVNNNVMRKDYHKLQTAIAVTVFIRGTMFTSNKPYYYMDS